MICDEVKRVAYFFLDGTLGQNKCVEVSKHLGLCPECEARTTIHRRIRIFLQKRLARLTAPKRLRQRLTRSLRAFAD
ncbi:MAG TPA: zf-HC2 domain-containing protein [Thermoanaerobaculia bacterium]|nr:zf-HC2 domain-containing protein [Thermoanaerobaculia bacterium]